jgi:hypothetical protein
VQHIERDLLEGALLARRHLLELLGVGPHEARERVDRFRRFNERTLEAIRTQVDRTQATAMARPAKDELEQRFQRDLQELERHHVAHWAGEPEASED